LLVQPCQSWFALNGCLQLHEGVRLVSGGDVARSEMLVAPGGSVIHGGQRFGSFPGGPRVGLGGGEQKFGVVRICRFHSLELHDRCFKIA